MEHPAYLNLLGEAIPEVLREFGELRSPSCRILIFLEGICEAGEERGGWYELLGIELNRGSGVEVHGSDELLGCGRGVRAFRRPGG